MGAGDGGECADYSEDRGLKNRVHVGCCFKKVFFIEVEIFSCCIVVQNFDLNCTVPEKENKCVLIVPYCGFIACQGSDMLYLESVARCLLSWRAHAREFVLDRDRPFAI